MHKWLGHTRDWYAFVRIIAPRCYGIKSTPAIRVIRMAIRYHAPRWAEADLFKLNDTVNTSVYSRLGAKFHSMYRGPIKL